MRKTVALCVAFLAVALAPAADAGGRNDVFTGPIEQTPTPGLPHKTTIELFIHTQHHRDGSTTENFSTANIYDVTLRCGNGDDVGAGEPVGNIDIVQVYPSHRIRIKRGSFDIPRAAGPEEEVIKMKGTVSKRAASGTLSVAEDLGTTDSGDSEEPVEHLGTCRSGILRWSASRSG